MVRWSAEDDIDISIQTGGRPSPSTLTNNGGPAACHMSEKLERESETTEKKRKGVNETEKETKVQREKGEKRERK